MSDSPATEYGKLAAKNERLRQASALEYEAWKEMKARELEDVMTEQKEKTNAKV